VDSPVRRPGTGILAKERPQLLDEQSSLFEGGGMPAAVGFA
jgi:hypothetical protein